jgi:hypothetical protein
MWISVRYSYGAVMNRPGSGSADHVVSAVLPGGSGSRRAPRSLRRTTGMGSFKDGPYIANRALLAVQRGPMVALELRGSMGRGA